MACGTEIEETELRAETETLEEELRKGLAKVEIGPQGAIAFKGGSERRMSDVCAYRRLTAKGSFALKRAVAAAEARQGRKLNAHAIGAGFHSHDGGRTWGRD